MLIGGMLAETIGIRPTVWLTTLGSLFALIWLLCSPVASMRDYPQTADASRIRRRFLATDCCYTVGRLCIQAEAVAQCMVSTEAGCNTSSRNRRTQFVGDCMPFFHDGTFHLYYLLDEDHHRARNGYGGHQWAHAASDDLIHWRHYPLAVPVGDEGEYDYLSICTGSTFYHDGVYYAFYATRRLAEDGTL